ncbi:MAG: nucleoside phosphorylase [Bacteroidia bacterium]|nr:nucleoside phosphorylase [Bacteroidia bacterium]
MNYLTPDSLILLDDGTVYHLGLKPEQIANKVILVGDPQRVAKVSQHFDRIEYITQRREFITHTGYIGKERLSVLSTGMGTDNIDIVLNELDILWNVDWHKRERKNSLERKIILRLGTAGGVNENIEIGDVVLSHYAIGMDNLGHYYPRPDEDLQKEFEHILKQQTLNTPFVPYFVQADSDFATYILQHTSCHAGITMTNPGFYAPQNRFLRQVRYPLQSFVEMMTNFSYRGNKVLNWEMETAGILALSNHLGFTAASLSVILAHRKKKVFAKNFEVFVQQLIEAGLSIITTYY